MARIRSIKPDFWTDEELARSLPRDIRLFYIALWNFSDDEGRCQGDPGYLKGQIFPYDDDLTPREIAIFLDQLQDLGKVVRYASNKGERFIWVVPLKKHQKIDDRYPSRLPTPPPGLVEVYKKKPVPMPERVRLASKYGACPWKKPVKVKCANCDYVGTVEFYRPSYVWFIGLEMDHIIPEVDGGQGVAENLQLLCRTCNRKKSAKCPPIPTEQTAGAADCPPMEGERRGEERRGIGNGGGTPPAVGREGGESERADPKPKAASNGQGEPSLTPRSIAEEYHEKDSTVPVPKAEVHVRRAIAEGVDPKTLLGQIIEHGHHKKLWSMIDELKNQAKSKGRPVIRENAGAYVRRTAESSEVIHARIDEARKVIDQKMTEISSEEISQWSREAQKKADDAHVHGKARDIFVEADLRIRAARKFGIKGVNEA